MHSFLTRHLIPAYLVLILGHGCCMGSPKVLDCASSSLSHCNQSLTGRWPAGAWELEASFQKNGSGLYFDLQWTANFENLRCFQILIKSDGIADLCKIKDYTEDSNKTDTVNVTLQIKMKETSANRNYTIELYTLPQQNAKPMVISKNLSFYYKLCQDWRADYVTIYDGNQLVVTFEKGPRICNIKSYLVQLANATNKLVFKKTLYEKENSSTLTATFSGTLCEGKYYITIVIKKAGKQISGCEDFNGHYQACMGSKSNLETYIPRIPCERDRNPANETAGVPKTNGRPAIILVINFVLLIILAILFTIYFWKSLQLKTKNRGIVLFVDDHPAHTDAVKRLVDYMKECHLDISLASHFLKHHDENNQLNILAEILRSDFVLLVLSFALQKRMEAWDKQQDYIEFFKEKNSNILSENFLEKIMCWNKHYVCKFDHVTDYGSRFKCCYSVPSHLREMVEDCETAGYNLSTFKYFKKKTLMNRFSVAVEKAANYEHSNSEWFREKYFCPRVIVTEENSNSYVEYTT